MCEGTRVDNERGVVSVKQAWESWQIFAYATK